MMQAMLTSPWRTRQGLRKSLALPCRDPGRFLLELVQNPAPNIHLIRSLDVKTGRVLHPEWLRGEARALGAGRLRYVGMCYC